MDGELQAARAHLVSDRPSQPVLGRRIGRWQYGEHPGLNPGWRLDGTNLVLDFDPGYQDKGCYVLWEDGRPGDAIDRYLDASMAWVEREQSDEVR